MSNTNIPDGKIEDIFTADQLKKVREERLQQNQNICEMTFREIPKGVAVFDHAHDSQQLLRGVVHRQANLFLGKIENSWTRYMGWWFNGTLSEALRLIANYLERDSLPYRHPHWKAKVMARFRSLKSAEKDEVLTKLGFNRKFTNNRERDRHIELLFRNKIGFDFIDSVITEVLDKRETHDS